MLEYKENFNKIRKETISSQESYLLRNYLKKHKPHYLIGMADSLKLEKIRKTISNTEVVFLDLGMEPDSDCHDIDNTDLRETDLTNHFPAQANKFINYRKVKNERERNEVSAKKSTFFWHRREKN